MVKAKDILDTLTPLIGGQNIHVYDVKVRLPQEAVEIFIDGPGGLSVEDCSRLHRNFLEALGDSPASDFQISISTPGASRKCIFPQDFEFHAHREFVFELKNGDHFEARVVSVDRESRLLMVQSKAGSRQISWDEVKKSRFVIRMKAESLGEA